MFCTASMCCWWVFRKSTGGLDCDMIPLSATLRCVTADQLLAKMIVVSSFSEIIQSYSRILDGFGEHFWSPQTEFPPSRRFKVEHKSKWRPRPNTDLSPPLAACSLFSLVSSLPSHQRTGCFLAHISPTPRWCHCSHGDDRRRGWWAVRRGCWLHRADSDHVMDPEIGHQILRVQPRGSLLAALTQMGAEPFKFINTLIAGCWSGLMMSFSDF